MAGNTFGQAFCLTSWGESHGPAIGGVVDGVPPGIPLDHQLIQDALDRRKPGKFPHTSSRQEPDRVEILSGVFEGQTLGTPISFMIRNVNHQSEDYDNLRHVLRPGHADYTYQKKYGLRDHRGGGRASARETAVRVAAGSIARQVLSYLFDTPIHIQGALIQINDRPILRDNWDDQEIHQNPYFCPDHKAVKVWQKILDEAVAEKRSLGAVVEVSAKGLPAGLGEPVYDRLDADLAKALMSINAVKGVEIGQGFGCVVAPFGFDEMNMEDGFLSNKAGGVLGGISTGQDIVCRMAIKPTSSTPALRHTITDLGEDVTVGILGRHDPCIGIRAVPIAEAMLSLVLADHALRWRGQCGTLTAF